jgi:hypothetical protein
MTCPDGKPAPERCLMRLNRRFFETAGITGDLEVQARGAALVPVLAQRGLSNEMLLAASWPPRPRPLCGFQVACGRNWPARLIRPATGLAGKISAQVDRRWRRVAQSAAFPRRIRRSRSTAGIAQPASGFQSARRPAAAVRSPPPPPDAERRCASCREGWSAAIRCPHRIQARRG